MILFPLILSFFVASCLAADSSGQTALNAENPNQKIDSLQMLAMKPILGALPTFLKACKSWPIEKAWAYSIGRALGMEKSTLTQTSTEDNTKSLLVHPTKVFEFLWDFGATAWSSDDNSSFKTIGDSFFPQLFDMELLRDNLANLEEPQTLEELRHLFAPCVICTEGMVTLDIAILHWLDQEIKDNFAPFIVEQSILEPMCALSLYPQVEEYCTDSILRIFDSVSINSENAKPFFFSFLNIIKQLDQGLVRSKIEELTAKSFALIYELGAQKLVLECRVRLGFDHDFVKLLEKSVPAEELQIIDISYQRIAKTIPQIFSLKDICCLDLFSTNSFMTLFNMDLQSAVISNGILKWDQSETVYTDFIEFMKQPRPETRMFILCDMELQDSVWNEISSCSNWKRLQYLLKRLSLTYGMAFLTTSFSYVLESD